LDVRLAGGVRKEMVFALTEVGDDRPVDAGEAVGALNADVEWLSVDRLTP
ncbi:MAG: tRNA-intron lyase, partial [Halorubrum sp.]